MDSAIAKLSRGRIVVTDRMHAAVLGHLLGKPVVMVDNVNKKLSAAYNDYFRDVADVHFALDFVEAYEIATSLPEWEQAV